MFPLLHDKPFCKTLGQFITAARVLYFFGVLLKQPLPNVEAFHSLRGYFIWICMFRKQCRKFGDGLGHHIRFYIISAITGLNFRNLVTGFVPSLTKLIDNFLSLRVCHLTGLGCNIWGKEWWWVHNLVIDPPVHRVSS